MSLIVIIGQFEIHPEDASAAAELMQAMKNETITVKRHDVTHLKEL